MTRIAPSTWRVRAHAKVNLTLRVLGIRADGYHELRTTFQSLALHDTLTFERARGPFVIASDSARCPTDPSNLVWQAAAAMWDAAGKRGVLSGVRAHIRKRIPMEAGLGGGSSDAAATLLALRAIWRVRMSDAALADIGRALGADVPFFLEGGTALGLERGDLLFPLLDITPAWVVIARPDFGVSTREAFGWWDQTCDGSGPVRQGSQKAASPASKKTNRAGRRVPSDAADPGKSWRGVSQLTTREWTNDLQAPVSVRHPQISRLIKELRRSGARLAAMSGSGSAVFGLFDDQRAAQLASERVTRPRVTSWVTRTTSRKQHLRLSAPTVRD